MMAVISVIWPFETIVAPAVFHIDNRFACVLIIHVARTDMATPILSIGFVLTLFFIY